VKPGLKSPEFCVVSKRGCDGLGHMTGGQGKDRQRIKIRRGGRKSENRQAEHIKGGCEHTHIISGTQFQWGRTDPGWKRNLVRSVGRGS